MDCLLDFPSSSASSILFGADGWSRFASAGACGPRSVMSDGFGSLEEEQWGRTTL